MTNKAAIRDMVSLPIGVFADRLLGDGIPEATRDHVASVQALLIVLDQHMPTGEMGIAPEKADDFKKEFFFKNMGRNYFDLKNDVMDIVPLQGDEIAQAIEQARDLVDSGRGAPKNVPPFGAILNKHLGHEKVNLCLQTQLAARLIAVTDGWDGADKFPEARSFPNDPEINRTLSETFNNTRTASALDEEAKLAAREVALHALMDAGRLFQTHGLVTAAGALEEFVAEYPAPKTASLHDARDTYNRLRGNQTDHGPKTGRPSV